MSRVRIVHSIPLEIIHLQLFPILDSCLTARFTKWSISFNRPTKSLYKFFFFPIHVACPIHLFRLDFTCYPTGQGILFPNFFTIVKTCSMHGRRWRISVYFWTAQCVWQKCFVLWVYLVRSLERRKKINSLRTQYTIILLWGRWFLVNFWLPELLTALH